MDLNMPGMGGVDATRHIAGVSPLTRVVVLTISDQDADVMDAILAGACGYLLKDSSIQDLMAGIQAAYRGESLISPMIAAKVLQRVRATSAQPEIADAIRSELSAREIEVLKLIANGKDNAVIAGELHISPKTVKNHISNILMKLQIDNRIQAAVYAVRSGVVWDSGAGACFAGARLEGPGRRTQLCELGVGVAKALGERRELLGQPRGAGKVRVARDLAEPPLDPPALGLE